MAKGKKSNEQTIKGDLWLLATLYSAGNDGINFIELNNLWQQNTELSYGEPLSRHTFIKRKSAIERIFGIIIIYKNGKYRILFDTDTGLGAARHELVRSIAILNILEENIYLDERIIFDNFERENKHVFPLLKAIKNQIFLDIWYNNDGKQQRCVFKPIYLKYKWRRWYVIGDKYSNIKIVERHIALDSIKKIKSTSSRQIEDIEIKDDHIILRPYGFK